MQREKHEASFGFCSESDDGIVWNVTCVLWVAAVLLLIGAICEGKVGSEESPCGEALPSQTRNKPRGWVWEYSDSIIKWSVQVCVLVCAHTRVCVGVCVYVCWVCVCVCDSQRTS